MTQDTLVVTQEDREAAEWAWDTMSDDKEWRDLHCDDKIAWWQAFARHRIAAEQRGFKLCQDAAVKVAAQDNRSPAAKEYGYFPQWHEYGQRLANAIRTLSIKETGNAG